MSLVGLHRAIVARQVSCSTLRCCASAVSRSLSPHAQVHSLVDDEHLLEVDTLIHADLLDARTVDDERPLQVDLIHADLLDARLPSMMNVRSK